MSEDRVVELVRSLPEETPSLAWRSRLNEGLRAEALRRDRRRSFVRRLRLAGVGFGAVAASLVGIALVTAPRLPLADPTPAAPRSSGLAPALTAPPSLASQADAGADLVALHDEGAAIAEVSAAGVDARESDLSDRELRLTLVQGML